jgi:hypothetical protein
MSAKTSAPDFVAGLSAALQAVRKAQASLLTGAGRADFAPFWASLVDLVKAYCSGPMPAGYSKLVQSFEELTAHVIRAFEQCTGDSERTLAEVTDRTGLVELLDLIECRLNRLQMPPAKKEPLHELVRLPQISLEQVVAMSGCSREEVEREAAKQKITLRAGVYTREPGTTKPKATEGKISPALADALAVLDGLVAEWREFEEEVESLKSTKPTKSGKQRAKCKETPRELFDIGLMPGRVPVSTKQAAQMLGMPIAEVEELWEQYAAEREKLEADKKRAELKAELAEV